MFTYLPVALVLRVLYRLLTLSEQAPFDSATYSYAYSLLNQVMIKGGVGLTEEDDPLEQVMLSLQIISFHCGECTFTIIVLVIARLRILFDPKFRTPSSRGSEL